MSQPKNSTIPISAQPLGQTVPVRSHDESAITALLADLPGETRDAVLEALEAERALAVSWWTFLNEMRGRRLLPDWMVKQYVGCSSDYDEMTAREQAVNMLLFGKQKPVSSSRRALLQASVDALNEAFNSGRRGDSCVDRPEVAQ